MSAEKLLYLGVNHGHLCIVLLKKLISRLVGIDSVVYEPLVALAYSISQGECINNKISILKYVQLLIKYKLLLYKELMSEKLIPHVSCGTGKDHVGVVILGYHTRLYTYLTVIASDIIFKFSLAIIVNIKLTYRYIKLFILCELIELLEKVVIVKVISIKEDNVLTSGARESLVSCYGRTCVVLGNDSYSFNIARELSVEPSSTQMISISVRV